MFYFGSFFFQQPFSCFDGHKMKINNKTTYNYTHTHFIKLNHDTIKENDVGNKKQQRIMKFNPSKYLPYISCSYKSVYIMHILMFSPEGVVEIPWGLDQHKLTSPGI